MTTEAGAPVTTCRAGMEDDTAISPTAITGPGVEPVRQAEDIVSDIRAAKVDVINGHLRIARGMAALKADHDWPLRRIAQETECHHQTVKNHLDWLALGDERPDYGERIKALKAPKTEGDSADDALGEVDPLQVMKTWAQAGQYVKWWRDNGKPEGLTPRIMDLSELINDSFGAIGATPTPGTCQSCGTVLDHLRRRETTCAACKP